MYLWILIEMKICYCHSALIQAVKTEHASGQGHSAVPYVGLSWGTWFCLSAGTPQHVPEICRCSSRVWLLPDPSSFALAIIHSLKPASLIYRRLILLFKCWDGDSSVVGSGWTSFSFVTGNVKVSCSKTWSTLTFTCLCTGHVYIVVVVTSFLGLSFLGERTVQEHL